MQGAKSAQRLMREELRIPQERYPGKPHFVKKNRLVDDHAQAPHDKA